MTPDEPPLLPGPPTVPLLAGPRGKRRMWLVAGGLLLAVLISFAAGWWVHHRREYAAEEANVKERDSIPTVSVMAVRASSPVNQLLLPGTITPIAEAALYARAAGYVLRRHVDIGDRVTKGQVLAEIESPEIDQQVDQARASVAQARQQLGQAKATVVDARAKLDLARVSLQRYRTLLEQDSVARQDVDVRQQEFQSAEAALQSTDANVGAADENVRAAEANLRRLVAMQDFEKVRAPFAGIVTARNVEVGALISSGGASLTTSNTLPGASSGAVAAIPAAATQSAATLTAGGQGPELFRIAEVDRLRVLVSVPQENAASITRDADATIFVHQIARRVQGKVVRTASAIDPATRTLLTEVQVVNREISLLPGMYAQVQFETPRKEPPLLVPGETLLFGAEGPMVAVLQDLKDEQRKSVERRQDGDKAKRIHLQVVQVGRDYGTAVEVTGGVERGNLVVVNPGDSVREDAIVLPRLLQSPDEQAHAAPSERKPSGIQSSSMEAPTQGAKGPNKGKQ